MANEKKTVREPSFILALIPIVAMIGFMLYCFRGHSESGYHDAHLPLVMSIVVACIVGHFCGHDFKDMLAGMIERLAASMEAVLILATVGFLVTSFMLSGELPAIRGWLRRTVRPAWLEKLQTLGGHVRTTLGGWLRAQLKLMGVTFTILTLGFVVLRIAYAPLWALVVALVDALPVLGTGTVLVPWAVICFLQGEGARAIGLLGVYAVVTLSRSMLEPKLVGRHLGLDPLVTLMALYVGYKLWGVGGMIFAPLLAVTIMQVTPGRERGDTPEIP